MIRLGQSDADLYAAACRFVAEAAEAAGTRPQTAAAYRELERRIVLGELIYDRDHILIERAIRFRESHRDASVTHDPSDPA